MRAPSAGFRAKTSPVAWSRSDSTSGTQSTPRKKSPSLSCPRRLISNASHSSTPPRRTLRLTTSSALIWCG
ncbi:hypothetical protein PA05_0126 [Cutibacterium acnes P05]|nr:hypothetical protein [Cutibacterium acnes P05]